jgi:hypothetical protein
MTQSTKLAYATAIGAVLLAAAVLLATAALVRAQPLPIPKTGQCPSGYASGASYCTPMHGTTRTAVPKVPGAQCPGGWIQSGGSCLGPPADRRR